MGGFGRYRLHDAEKAKNGLRENHMKKWKQWLSGFAGVLVTIIGINLGLPVPVAVQVGNEAKEQIQNGSSETTPDYQLETIAPAQGDT